MGSTKEATVGSLGSTRLQTSDKVFDIFCMVEKTAVPKEYQTRNHLYQKAIYQQAAINQKKQDHLTLKKSYPRPKDMKSK